MHRAQSSGLPAVCNNVVFEIEGDTRNAMVKGYSANALLTAYTAAASGISVKQRDTDYAKNQVDSSDLDER